MSAHELITDHLDLWTQAITQKSTAGRGSNGKVELTGIKKLRELILELAVRGKLVEQDDNEESTDELLQQLEVYKAKLQERLSIRRPKPLSSTNTFSPAHNLPKEWASVCLDEVGITQIGLTYSPKNISIRGTPVLRSSNVQNGKLDFNDLVRVESVVPTSIFVEEGDLLVCARNGSKALVGKTAMISDLSEPMTFGAFMAIFRSPINPYVQVFLNSPMFRQELEGTSTTTINQITQNKLRSTRLPLPPLEEQYRIVQKVDELMALCDRLEQHTSDQLDAHETLVDTLLGTLTQSANASELADNWARLAEHFDTLFITEQSIDKLKQTILQLAVMGRLVEQDAGDEPAAKLQRKIKEEKSRLVEAGVIKRQKSQPAITGEEIPFSLPAIWIWTRWDDLCIKIGDIDHKMPPTAKNGFPYISPRDFLPGNGINFDDAKKVSEDDFRRLAAKIQPCRGDIIYPRYGTIGDNRLVETDIEFLASYSCAVIKPLPDLVSSRFFYILSLSGLTKAQSKAAENKTTQANVGIGSIKKFLFPLPPIAEQHRIVQKVDELMALCDHLKKRLTQASETRCQLAGAVVEGALS